MRKGITVSRNIPPRWEEYRDIGCPMRGTPFVVFKTPLSQKLNSQLAIQKRFNVNRLCQLVPNLGFVIDLTCVDGIYNSDEIRAKGIKFHKMVLRDNHISELTAKTFFNIVDNYMVKPAEAGKLIGVHCTYGVNKSGYYVIRYMIQRLGFTPDQAISEFEDARGHSIDDPHYLKLLKGSLDPIPAIAKLRPELLSRYLGPKSTLAGVPVTERSLEMMKQKKISGKKLERMKSLKKQWESVSASKTVHHLLTSDPIKISENENTKRPGSPISTIQIKDDTIAVPKKPEPESSFNKAKSMATISLQNSHFYSAAPKYVLAKWDEDGDEDDNLPISSPPHPPSSSHFYSEGGVCEEKREPETPPPPHFNQEDFEKGSDIFRREFAGDRSAEEPPYNNQGPSSGPRDLEMRSGGVRSRLGPPVNCWSGQLDRTNVQKNSSENFYSVDRRNKGDNLGQPGPMGMLPVSHWSGSSEPTNVPKNSSEKIDLINTRSNSDGFGQFRPMSVHPEPLKPEMAPGPGPMNAGIRPGPIGIGGPIFTNMGIGSGPIPVPMGTAPMPMRMGPGMINPNMYPVGPVPRNIGPMGPMTNDQGPMTIGMGPGPAGVGPGPAGIGPGPEVMGLGPMGMGVGPIGMGLGPVKVDHGPMGISCGPTNMESRKSDTDLSTDHFGPPARPSPNTGVTVDPFAGSKRYDERCPFPDRRSLSPGSVHSIPNMDNTGVQAVRPSRRSPEKFRNHGSRDRSPRSRSPCRGSRDYGRSRRDDYNRSRKDYDDRYRRDEDPNRSRRTDRPRQSRIEEITDYILDKFKDDKDRHGFSRKSSPDMHRRDSHDRSRRENRDRSESRFDIDRHRRSRSPLRKSCSPPPPPPPLIHDLGPGKSYFYEQNPELDTNIDSDTISKIKQLQRLKDMVDETMEMFQIKSRNKFSDSMEMVPYGGKPKTMEVEEVHCLKSLQMAAQCIGDTLEYVKQPRTDPFQQHVPVSQKTVKMNMMEYKQSIAPRELNRDHQMIPGYVESYELKRSTNVGPRNVEEFYTFKRAMDNPEMGPLY